ncbi:MAG: adenylyltransferase/cytidyltransferase family protein [Thermoplasmata archaeon]
MKVVMASGVFDILHLGHVHYLNEARKFGDKLVVVVARDVTVLKRKGRLPIVPDYLRVQMVSALKPVDEAILGDTEDFYKTVEAVKPDVIVLGYDQKFDPKEIERECEKRGLIVKVERAPPLSHDLLATRRIIQKILEREGDRGKKI